MGRRKNRKSPEALPEYDWPWEVSIKIDRSRPRIAFLSGAPRDYYPEDPGVSRFGITYCLPISDDTALPNYYPSDDRLNKPISLLGYGIGGLLGPRFAPLPNEDNPPPNIYQSELIPAPVKRQEKAKQKKWTEFVEEYKEIVEQQCEAYEAEQNGLGGEIQSGRWSRKSLEVRQKSSPLLKKPSSRVKPAVQLDKKKEMAKLCPKKFAAFGMGFENTRFVKQELEDKPGVGTYETNTPALKSSFQITTPEGKLVPRVRVCCHPSGCDHCIGCAKDLISSDYYQTKLRFRIVNKVDPETDGPYKMLYLSMCRGCYCEALKIGHDPWTKEQIPGTFVKARHCRSIHDHKEGHPEFLMKSTCKGMLNLARKEIIFSRHFKDNPCEKTR